MKTNNNRILTILWGCIVVLLLGACAYEFVALQYNLKSIYDEAYFYILSVRPSEVITIRPPSLAMDILHGLIPNVELCDILTMRRYSFAAKGFALLLFIVGSCYFVYRRFSEKRIYPYLSLVASELLISLLVMPSISFTWDDTVTILVTLAFALCLLCSVAAHKYVKYVEVALVGIVGYITLLCNLPAGCMLIALCAAFLILDNYQGIKESLCVILCGLIGIVVGAGLVHFFIISIPDIYGFVQENFLHATSVEQANAHSLAKVLFVIFFGFRDLLTTTLVLCGITFISLVVYRRFNKYWLTIGVAILCFIVVYLWMAKPMMTLAAVMCWLVVMFLVYHIRHKSINVRDILLILFAFILPIGTVFGTNTTILGKAIACSASWGFLLFYLYYLSRPEIHKYAAIALLVTMFCVIQEVNLPGMTSQQGKYLFCEKSPVARMYLNDNQMAFYNEVDSVLVENGFNRGSDTILGFCFNDMTILAMNALPYTNEQQPEEFLHHNIEELPLPKYMIFTEWDSVVLYNRLAESGWGFPENYTYYKCINHPDPTSEYRHTQSMMYCHK